MVVRLIVLGTLIFNCLACNTDDSSSDDAVNTNEGDSLLANESDANSTAGPDTDSCPGDPDKTEPGQCGCGQPEGTCDDSEPQSGIVLNLRIHIMRDIAFQVQGIAMTNDHITPSVVRNELLPELNTIWNQADISWKSESIIEENVIKSEDFEEQKSIVEKAVRDEEGHSDPARLPPLYGFMDPENRSTLEGLETNLFHMYIFPFIGNTSQGNAMRSFGFHTVVGSWSNKSNGGGKPIKRQYRESWEECVKGSLARTMAHELGHVLTLTHSQCNNCLMRGCGYGITNEQVVAVQQEAKRRME